MYNTNKTINGTFGEVWVDDYYMAEVTGLQAKVTLKKDSVNQTGTLAEGYKVTGLECKGTLKYNKVTSYFIRLLSENLKKEKKRSAPLSQSWLIRKVMVQKELN